MKFLLFSDFHYKEGMYAIPVSELQKTIERGGREQVDMILHGGDLCNDYYGSPELVNCLLKNVYGLPVYGVYGNHEMESVHNTMQYVTSHLTNRAEEVAWGTDDGKIGDGSIAYYYFDREGLRFICLDSNYSLTPDGVLEHNREASWGAPAENTLENSLGEKQLAWFEGVLSDAAESGKHCILLSHITFLNEWHTHPDNDRVMELIRAANVKRPKTVIACLNGHYHTNGHAVRDNVLFFDVNTAMNGCWEGGHEDEPGHYGDCTYEFVPYDENGKPCRDAVQAPIDTAWMSKDTWYFKNALSAVVTVDENLKITVDGMKTEWVYGIIPPNPRRGKMPEISSFTFEP